MRSGAINFIKYAYPPNKLRYCGPSNNQAVYDYFKNKVCDDNLTKLLVKFNGAYPNLQYISSINNISDPFDNRVVEAYWIGNNLLNHVSINSYYCYLKNRYKGEWNNQVLDEIFKLSKPFGAKPHHSFHVLSMFAKKKKTQIVLEHINSCFITHGRVVKNDLDGVIVTYCPIMKVRDKFVYRDMKQKKIKYFGLGKLQIGTDVSFHWNYICDRITSVQVYNLRLWNLYHLNIVNEIN